jgi:hypothetical protein
MKTLTIGPLLARLLLMLHQRPHTRTELRKKLPGYNQDQAVLNAIAKGYAVNPGGIAVELTRLGNAALPLCRAWEEVGFE